MDNRQHTIEEIRNKSCTKKTTMPDGGHRRMRFGSGRGTVAYGPPPNNTSAVAQNHCQSAFSRWPQCCGHRRNDIRRWPTFIIVTKAISFFKIFHTQQRP